MSSFHLNVRLRTARLDCGLTQGELVYKAIAVG